MGRQVRRQQPPTRVTPSVEAHKRTPSCVGSGIRLGNPVKTKTNPRVGADARSGWALACADCGTQVPKRASPKPLRSLAYPGPAVVAADPARQLTSPGPVQRAQVKLWANWNAETSCGFEHAYSVCIDRDSGLGHGRLVGPTAWRAGGCGGVECVAASFAARRAAASATTANSPAATSSLPSTLEREVNPQAHLPTRPLPKRLEPCWSFD